VQILQKQGYSIAEISDFSGADLQEQFGGSRQVAIDRKQRRRTDESDFARLQTIKPCRQDLHQLAETTEAKLEKVV